MTASPTPQATPHKFFSPARVSAIASNTLLELVRLKVFYFMLLFALLGIGISFPLASMKIHEQFQILKDASLGAMSVFTWLLAVLATAMLLPKDIEDRTLYTILAKPVPRFEDLLGKFIGILLMLFVALSAMTVFFLGILYFRQQTALADALRTTPPNLLDAELRSIRASAFNVDLVPGIVLIYLKSALSAALTLLLSTFASSSIFTIMVSCVVYLIGHVQHIARDAFQDSPNASPLLIDFLGAVAIMVPDMNALSFVDEVVVNSAVPAMLFIKAGILALVYIGAYFLLGYLVFWGKEL
jgi:ABC-type Na+ efflux pump permease subunit